MYLKYDINTNRVVAIQETEPIAEDGYSVAKSDSYQPGDEFEYYIILATIDENGNVTSCASVRQSAPATEILKENALLKQRVTELEQLMADLASLQLGV